MGRLVEEHAMVLTNTHPSDARGCPTPDRSRQGSRPSMARTVRRLRATSGHVTLVSGVLLATCLTASAAQAEDLALSFGRWSVESRGFGWPCRLEALEVRESNRVGEPLLVGFERGEDGRPRAWGSSKIDRKATGPLASCAGSRRRGPRGRSLSLIQAQAGTVGETARDCPRAVEGSRGRRPRPTGDPRPWPSRRAAGARRDRRAQAPVWSGRAVRSGRDGRGEASG